MDNNRTSKLEALLKVANAKKQAVTKIPINELLQHAKSRQEKKASTQPAIPRSLYCRLVASMQKTAGKQVEEKKESPKADTSKPQPTKSESSKSESSKSTPASAKPATPTTTKPAASAQKPAPPHPTTPKPAPPPASAMQGASPGFDWQSILKTLQPYAAPVAAGAGVGALGSLMLPQGTNPGESALQYQRRQRNRMIGGGIVGGGSAAALLAAYNAYKARKGMAMR